MYIEPANLFLQCIDGTVRVAEYVVALAARPIHVIIIIVESRCFSLLNIMTWSAVFSARALHYGFSSAPVWLLLIIRVEVL